MKALLPVALLATTAVAVAPAHDDSSEALRRAKAEQARSAQRAAALTTQHDAASAAVARSDQDAAGLARDLGEAEARLKAAEIRAREAVAAEKMQAARVAQTRAPLAAMTAALARIARRPPALALASGDSLSDASHLAVLIRHMREQVAAQNATLNEELSRRSALREERVRAVAELDASRRSLDQRRQLLARSRIDLVARQTLLAAAAEEESERLRGLAEESAALGSALGDTKRDRELTDRLAALPGPVLADGTPSRPARAGPSFYQLPSFGSVIAGTGERDADGVKARGLTLATAPGVPVLAPGAGRVLYAGPFRNYGDIVIIDHGHGWTSLIAGLSRTSTELGADLFQGAPIGRSARRLLIELRHGGQPVDIVAMADAMR